MDTNEHEADARGTVRAFESHVCSKLAALEESHLACQDALSQVLELQSSMQNSWSSALLPMLQDMSRSLKKWDPLYPQTAIAPVPPPPVDPPNFGPATSMQRKHRKQQPQPSMHNHSGGLQVHSSASQTTSGSAGSGVNARALHGDKSRWDVVSTSGFCLSPPDALPPTWPECLQKRTKLSRNSLQSHKSLHGLATPATTTPVSGKFGRKSANGLSREGRQFQVLDPNSHFRVLLDLCSVLVLLYDLTILPVMLAWEVSFTGFHTTFQFASNVYWSFDLVINFLTGFDHEGEAVTALKPAMRHYLTHMFLLDLILVLVGWSSMLMDSLGRGGIMLRFAKLSRGMRIFGLFRLVRLSRFFEEFIERSLSESIRLRIQVALVFLGIVWITHLLCCGWMAMGTLFARDPDLNWLVADFGVVYGDLGGQDQYFAAFHWAIAQVTLGGTDIAPLSSEERLYNIACLMLGLLCSITLVSSLSTMMIDSRMSEKEQKTKMKTLRKYLRQAHLDARIIVKVQRQVVSRLKPKMRVSEDEVPALALLSRPLRQELFYQVSKPHLDEHPLFHLWQQLDTGILRRVCDEAISSRFLMSEDQLFSAGTTGDEAYCLTEGSITYTQEPDFALEPSRTTLDEGTWFCEATIWSEWIHVGDMDAVTHSGVLEIACDVLLEMLLGKGSLAEEITREYGVLFHKRVVAAKPPNADWPTDLSVPYSSFSDLVANMAFDTQVFVGNTYLDRLQGTSFLRRAKLTRLDTELDRLRDEVNKGVSIVVMNQKGEIQRIASVGVVKIDNKSGDILAQIAKWDEETEAWEPQCKLPGLKQERGETSAEVFRRIMQTKLTPIVDSVVLLKTYQEETWHQSRTYGVSTKYLRTVCVCSLRNGMEGVAERQEDRDAYQCGQSLFAWLKPDEFDELQDESVQGNKIFEEWLSELHANSKRATVLRKGGDSVNNMDYRSQPQPGCSIKVMAELAEKLLGSMDLETAQFNSANEGIRGATHPVVQEASIEDDVDDIEEDVDDAGCLEDGMYSV